MTAQPFLSLRLAGQGHTTGGFGLLQVNTGAGLIGEQWPPVGAEHEISLFLGHLGGSEIQVRPEEEQKSATI